MAFLSIVEMPVLLLNGWSHAEALHSWFSWPIICVSSYVLGDSFDIVILNVDFIYLRTNIVVSAKFWYNVDYILPDLHNF